MLSHQTSTLSTQAGILQPRPHVLVGIDDQRTHHQDPLPVLHYPLTALHTTHRILSFTGNITVFCCVLKDVGESWCNIAMTWSSVYTV